MSRSRTTLSGWSASPVLAAALAIGVLSGCGKKATDEPGTQATPAQSSQASAASGVSAQVAAMGTDALREAASKALAEQRLYAPAGDNAMEYYVAMRAKAPNDAAAASALSDLMPYVLIATEQSIGREDFSEAQRLYALIQQADPQAPALPRLKQGIADAQAALAKRTADTQNQEQAQEQAQQLAELERQRQLQQQRAQEQASAQLPPQTGAPRPSPTIPATTQPAAPPPASASAPQAVPQASPAPSQQASQSAPEPPATQPASAPASSILRAVSTPSPVYPPAALRDQQSGEVVVEFTVNPDGSVSNPRVVSSKPARVFDRATLNAVRRWRFQPVAEATTTRRTIGFSPRG